MNGVDFLEVSSVSEADFVREYNRLSDRNKKRLSVMKAEGKRRSLAGLILLRRQIAEHYGISDYEFTYNGNGKPLLTFCHFSISHSANLAVCSVSDTPVGVDTELLREIPFRNDYRLFTLEEVMYVNELQAEHDLRFFEVWTKKESYIKAKGLKLADGTGINVLNIPDAEFTTEINGKNIITLCKLKNGFNLLKTEE